MLKSGIDVKIINMFKLVGARWTSSIRSEISILNVTKFL